MQGVLGTVQVKTSRKPSYLCVVEETSSGYSAFLPDVPGVVAAAADIENLVVLLRDALCLHLLDDPEPPKAVTEKFEDPEIEVFRQFFVEPSDPEQISLLIDALVKESGINRAELARLMDIPKSSISRLTNPIYRGHSMTTLRKIADALGYEVEVTFRKAS